MTRRPVTRAQVEQIIELGNSKLPVEIIARTVGVSHAVVKLWLDRGSLHGSPDWDHGDFHAPWREAAGVDEQTMRPKYGPDYQPLSARTGRETAQETAMRAFSESIDGIPVKGYSVPGLWDTERERAEGPRRSGAKNREDAEATKAWVLGHAHLLTPRLYGIYQMYWERGMACADIADELRRLGLGNGSERKVRQAVEIIRQRRHGKTGARAVAGRPTQTVRAEHVDDAVMTAIVTAAAPPTRRDVRGMVKHRTKFVVASVDRLLRSGRLQERRETRTTADGRQISVVVLARVA